MSELQASPTAKATTPTWVKVFGLVAAVFVVGFVALHLAGGGFGSHMHSAR